MRTDLAWVLVLGAVLFPVTNRLYSVEFSATSSPLVISAADDALYELSYDTSYALVLWVKWGLVPTAASIVAQISNGAQPILAVTQGTNGKWTAAAASSSGLATAISSIYSTTVWTHIGVSVCSVTGQLTLYVTQMARIYDFLYSPRVLLPKSRPRSYDSNSRHQSCRTSTRLQSSLYLSRPCRHHSPDPCRFLSFSVPWELFRPRRQVLQLLHPANLRDHSSLYVWELLGMDER